jgi:hypothetical protein
VLFIGVPLGFWPHILKDNALVERIADCQPVLCYITESPREYLYAFFILSPLSQFRTVCIMRDGTNTNTDGSEESKQEIIIHPLALPHADSPLGGIDGATTNESTIVLQVYEALEKV